MGQITDCSMIDDILFFFFLMSHDIGRMRAPSLHICMLHLSIFKLEYPCEGLCLARLVLKAQADRKAPCQRHHLHSYTRYCMSTVSASFPRLCSRLPATCMQMSAAGASRSYMRLTCTLESQERDREREKLPAQLPWQPHPQSFALANSTLISPRSSILCNQDIIVPEIVS